jgi:apolipoprotein N-acyltransferase
MWHQAQAVQIPLGMILVMLIIPASIFGLTVLLFRALVRRGNLWQACLAFPSAWVTVEFLNALLSPHGAYPSLGYSQLDCLLVLQLVSLVGVWGISFCLLLLPATAAALLNQQGSDNEKTKLAVVVTAILAVVIVYGVWRLNDASQPGHSVKIALLATDANNKSPDMFPQDDESALTLVRH